VEYYVIAILQINQIILKFMGLTNKKKLPIDNFKEEKLNKNGG